MAETVDVERISLGNIPKALELCNKKIKEFEGNEVKKAKYEKMKAALSSAKQKIDDTIKYLNEKEPTFYEDSIKGRESAVTLAWLGTKLAMEGKTVSTDLSESPVDVHYDFIDETKKQMLDISKGKGIAKGIAGVSIAAIIGEVLSRGVTQILVKKGIMKGAMSLLGVTKLGIANLPAAFSAMGAGMTSLWGVASIGVVGAAALAAVAVIPAVTKFVKKAKAKHNANHEFEHDMDKMIKAQEELAF